MGKARDEKSALNRLSNRVKSEITKKSASIPLSNRFASEMTEKSKCVISEIMKKSKRVKSAVTEKRICIASASRKSSVLEKAKIVEKSRAIPSPFLTGGQPFCMIKKNTFPAGASRINRQKIGAA